MNEEIISARIPHDLLDRIRHEAYNDDRSLSYIIRKALEEKYGD